MTFVIFYSIMAGFYKLLVCSGSGSSAGHHTRPRLQPFPGHLIHNLLSILKASFKEEVLRHPGPNLRPRSGRNGARKPVPPSVSRNRTAWCRIPASSVHMFRRDPLYAKLQLRLPLPSISGGPKMGVPQTGDWGHHVFRGEFRRPGC